MIKKLVFQILILLVILLAVSSCKKDKTLTAGSINSMAINSSIRGEVALEVYLPPSWQKDDGKDYPLIFFLHGQGGNETSFFYDVDYRQLNDWINNGDLPPFVLVAIASYFEDEIEQQWSTRKNEVFLTSDETGELRAFCRRMFNAGTDANKISIHGQSRGARGALHYAFKYSDKFTAAMSNAFVSDYALEEEKQNALQNKAKIKDSGIKIRMVIGTEDEWVLDRNRQASYIMHDYLKQLDIEHEFEVLQGAGHSLNSMWNTVSNNHSPLTNGFYEFKLHAESWQN